MPSVNLEIREGVALITLDNPEVKNALTIDMAAQLVDICDLIDENPEVGAAVIRGADGTFCSGADTRTWTSELLTDEAVERASAVYDAFVRFGNVKPLTITAARGSSVGAGMNLFLAADLRIVATDAKLIAGFLRIGLHPGGGFFALLGRTAGRDVTAAFGLLGERLSGTDAVRHGLAWEAVADEEVEPRALELAARVAKDPLLARRATGSMRRALGPPPIPWESALEAERGLQLWTAHRLAERRAASDD